VTLLVQSAIIPVHLLHILVIVLLFQSSSLCSPITCILLSGSHKTSEKFEPIRVHFAINSGDVAELRRLISAGDRVDLNFVARCNTPLTLSILNNYFEIAGILVNALPDVDLLIPERTAWRRQPIHLAVRSGMFEQHTSSNQSLLLNYSLSLSLSA